MRLIKLVIISAALAATMAFGATAGAQAEGCFSNSICRFTGLTYNVRDRVIECSQWGVFTGFGASATNRCGNKSNWLRYNGTVVACMNPGGERPHIGGYNEIYVPFEYGAFC